ncbi:DUF5994 family protein [Amycolatopsis sp. NPDC054798]
MTPNLDTAASTLSAMKAAEPPWRVPRLRSKPAGRATGHVDGAWWPYTRDLATELPALLGLLALRLDRIERVAYCLADWPPARRGVTVDGAVVRLEGFRSQHPGTVTVIGAWGRLRVTLLVVPPDTEPADARHILTTAAHRDNRDSVETLLAARGGREARTAAGSGDEAAERWDAEGGRLRAPA